MGTAKAILFTMLFSSSIHAAEVDYKRLADDAVDMIDGIEEAMAPLGTKPIPMGTFIQEVWLPGVATLLEWPEVDWDGIATRNVCRFALQYALIYWQHSLELGQRLPQSDKKGADYRYYRYRCEAALKKFQEQGHAD